ncbi:hypothetical protein JHK87_055869 [Glycine soja]|nr:hypothetical protein JHK87_055869 [Glycine soja]
MGMNMKMSYRVMLVLFSLFMFVIPSMLSNDSCGSGRVPLTPIRCPGRSHAWLPHPRLPHPRFPPEISASSFEVARPVPPSFNRPRNIHYP